MFITHSLKNVIRSWKKSILFFFLIVMLVMIICMGVSLTVTINDFLNDCKDSYTTTAVFEYMGPTYPDETTYDPNIVAYYDTVNSMAMESNSCVEQWDPTAMSLGYIDGISGMNFLAPYKNNAVIVVHVYGYKDSEMVYSSTVTEALYSYRDKEGLMVYINSMGLELENDHYYLIHGEFYFGNSSYLYFKPTAYINASAESIGFDGSIDNMIVDITSENGKYTIPSDSIFHEIATTYAVINNSVTVQATNSLESLLSFQQNTLYLVDGRGFLEQEYVSNVPVCVISEALAQSLNVNLGDQINLSMAVQNGCSMNESYWAGSGFAYTKKYTVVGLINTLKEMKNNVFIPKTDAFDLSANRFSYTLGQAKLHNDKANQFVTDITPLLQDRVRLTVYDQGYASIVQPLKDVLRVAILITCICAIACLAIVFLFGFLFVYRQKDIAKIMRRLGAKKINIYCYFLFGSGCISLTAVTIGMAVSRMMSDWCIDLVHKTIGRYAADDLLYSNGSLSIVKAIEFAPKMRTDIFILIGSIVFLLTNLSCFLFAALCIKSHIHRRRSFLSRGGTRSCSLQYGPLKYAWLSIRRGHFRTFIPIIVSTCVILLLFQLTNTTTIYNTRLDELNKSSDIKGFFTDISGKQTSGLSIDGIIVNELAASGYLSKINVTKKESYYYIGGVTSNGKPIEVPQIILPTSSFGMETFLNKLINGPDIVYTNDLSSVPEFYYSSTINTDFSYGYDVSVFGQEIDDIPCCVISTAFMEENSVKLGDIIRILIFDGIHLEEVNMLAVGSYVKAGKIDNIYCQLGYYISPTLLLDSHDEDKILINYTFHSVHFQLTGSEVLPTLKNYLYDKGYSEVNKIRKFRNFITIEDKVFLSSKSAMTQRIWYMNHTFPVLYILIELLAGYIPYILIQLRKREVGIMRAQGASKRTAFYSIFLEQEILCIVGVMLAILISLVLFKEYNSLGFILAGTFILCWLTGTFISGKQLLRCSIQSILKAEE